uniref:Uncharacterized protein n=1 Tax=Noccaea caerulescens TaxID=107243 RepID=A0A1J3JEG6_NOCCA
MRTLSIFHNGLHRNRFFFNLPTSLRAVSSYISIYDPPTLTPTLLQFTQSSTRSRTVVCLHELYKAHLAKDLIAITTEVMLVLCKLLELEKLL